MIYRFRKNIFGLHFLFTLCRNRLSKLSLRFCDCSIILESDVTDKEFIKQLHILSQKINLVRDQSAKGN